MAGDRAVGSALARWRDAERRLGELTPGTREYIDAALEYERARSAYASALSHRLDVTGEGADVQLRREDEADAPEAT
jgi:hypothetical protein